MRVIRLVYMVGVMMGGVLTGAFRTLAVSAYPNAVEAVQPDGTRITVFLRGDEHLKWARTPDGYSLLRNSRGYFEYAMLDSARNLVPSGRLARNAGERSGADQLFLQSTPKELSFSPEQVGMIRTISRVSAQPRYKSATISGSRKYLCILIGYTDKPFTRTKSDFENLLNQVAYATESATGSVADFYRENSYGQLNIAFTVAGPYVASHNLAYYGANDSKGYDVNPEALVKEAVTLADPDVDYSGFDNDGDGAVDGVYVIHAGYGEDSGAAANTIWAHTGSIPPVILDGKTISDYACSSELRGTSGTGITRIGVICHELGHILGAMDFYDTNYTTNGTYDGTGDWDLMGNGSWNNNGITPAHHNPYTKIYTYGWATAKGFTSGATITLKDAENNNSSFYKVNTATPNEFFLIENRQKLKFDSYLPGHGMVIYHVDGNYINSAGDAINTGSHQGLYPVCANATGLPPTTYGTINGAGLPFPGTGNKTSFTDFTTPNALSWASAKTNAPITGISEDNTNKTVTFLAPVIPDPPPAVTASPASNIRQNTFDAGWNFTATATSYRVDVSVSPDFSSFVSGYNDRDVGNVKAWNVSGLNTRTTYYYRVRAINLGGASANSNVVVLKTFSLPPAAPVMVSAVSCNNLVTLRWKKNSDPYFQRYRIYGGLFSNATSLMDSTTASVSDTSRVISGLIHGQTYYFRITAVNDDGPESGYSNQFSTVIKTGIIPVITVKWGDVLICSNLGDSIRSYQWYRNGALIPSATGQFYSSSKQTGAYQVVTADYDGCRNPSNTISNPGLKSATLWPNPASTTINLRLNTVLEGDAVISVFNAAGIRVMEFSMVNPGTDFPGEIPVRNLEEGMYIVNVTVDGEPVWSSKFVVKK